MDVKLVARFQVDNRQFWVQNSGYRIKNMTIPVQKRRTGQ